MMKKAQIWGFDMMIAVIILVFGIFMFYFYILNYSGNPSEKVDSLFYDAELVSDKILSEGYPLFWNSSNVIIPGILTNGKIDLVKLEKLYNMTNETVEGDFDKVRIMLNTKYKFFFNLSKGNFEISTGNINGIGIAPNESAVNLVKHSRVSVYNNLTKSIDFYIWE